MHTHLTKGSRGFGFNIVGGSRPREFLQVYSVTASGPSALKTGKNTMIPGRLLHEKTGCNVLLLKICEVISFTDRKTILTGHSCRLRAVTRLLKSYKTHLNQCVVTAHLSSSLSPFFGDYTSGILISHSKCISQSSVLNPRG